MSVSWSRQTPPTEREMMAMVSMLETRLTPSELRDRKTAFEKLRAFIRRAAAEGGTEILPSRSFPYPPVHGIRVDIEVFKGTSAVPEKKRSD